MTDREIESRIAKAIENTAPNDFEDVLSRCESQKGNVIFMTMTKRKTFKKALVAACLALMLIGTGTAAAYSQLYSVASIVSLDVNPSIELKVNKNEKIVACEALNEEAKAILADMEYGKDLKGAKLDVAVNAIVGSLVRHGYLDSISSAILISVEDNDQNRAAKLRQDLTSAVDVILRDKELNAAVLSQTVAKDSSLEKQAKENNVSTGKAALANSVLAKNGELRFSDLAKLSVDELKDLIESNAPGLPIGKKAALQSAKEDAGVKQSDILYEEADSEIDDLPAHYEVELYTSSGKLEYIIDAYTGKVLHVETDDDDAPVSVSKPEGSVSAADKDNKKDKGNDIGEDKALKIAFDHAGVKKSKASALKVEKDYDDGVLEYELEFWLDGAEFKYTVRAYDGAILDFESDYHVSASTKDIGDKKASLIALSHAGLNNGKVKNIKVDVDEDDGRIEYEVKFKHNGIEYEYTVDAASGTILEREMDRDDDWFDDDDDDWDD